MILIHMPGEYPWAVANPKFFSVNDKKHIYGNDVEDLAQLVQIGKMFPNIQFVIAHSLNSFELVEKMAKMIKENSLSNFWIEISQSLTHLDPDRSKPINEKNSWRQFASSWRHFGIARILFGSDQTVGENGISEDRYDQGKTFEEEVASINSDPFLSPDEKHLILKKNGEQFLKLICDSCSTYPPVSQ